MCVSFHAVMLLLCSGTPVFTRQQSSLVAPQGGTENTAAPYDRKKMKRLGLPYFTQMSYLLWHFFILPDSFTACDSIYSDYNMKTGLFEYVVKGAHHPKHPVVFTADSFGFPCTGVEISVS